MEKKVLAVFVSLFALTSLTIPVLCAPSMKIEGVTLSAVTTPVPDYMHWVSDDTIRHSSGTTTGTVTLFIPGHPLPGGTWNSTWANNGNFKKDPAEIVIRGKVVLAFTGEGTTGTFEGVIQRTIIGYPPSDSSIFIDHMVLQGTGDFKGWTLKLSHEGARGTPPMINEGYVIIPK